MAPEVFDKNYNMACDLWSAGIILYTMLCGFPPFIADDESDLRDLIKEGEVEFDEECELTEEAKDLILHLLQR